MNIIQIINNKHIHIIRKKKAVLYTKVQKMKLLKRLKVKCLSKENMPKKNATTRILHNLN